MSISAKAVRYWIKKIVEYIILEYLIKYAQDLTRITMTTCLVNPIECFSTHYRKIHSAAECGIPTKSPTQRRRASSAFAGSGTKRNGSSSTAFPLEIVNKRIRSVHHSSRNREISALKKKTRMEEGAVVFERFEGYLHTILAVHLHSVALFRRKTRNRASADRTEIVIGKIDFFAFFSFYISLLYGLMLSRKLEHSVSPLRLEADTLTLYRRWLFQSGLTPEGVLWHFVSVVSSLHSGSNRWIGERTWTLYISRGEIGESFDLFELLPN